MDNLQQKRAILKLIEGKNFSKTIWSPIGKAMNEYNMIEEGDRIAIGLSGGKDSITTLNAILRVKLITNINFDIIPIHVHPSTDKSSYLCLEQYCNKLGLNLKIIETNLDEILFNEKKEFKVKNPCFLCGRIRRGVLYNYMTKEKINKLALGHHKDDIIETFFMNVFYQGNMNMMKPSYKSKQYGVQIIRPLSFVEEKDIIKYITKNNIKIQLSDCPFENSEKSKRLKIKNLIKELSKDNKDIRSTILNSITPMLKEKLEV